MKLGIYMGSFNPPHKGHVKIINHLLEKEIVDKIIVVPTLNYWDKNDLAPILDRINMLKFYENDKVIIDTKHNKYIYTYELIKVMEKEYPNDELYIIMGADNIIHLDKWKNYEGLLKYHIIVMNRGNIDIKKYTKKYHGNFIIIDDFKFVDISSTDIRNNLSSKYLDKEILNYIKEKGLYL